MTPTLPPNESLTVEFKSDLKRLPDRELVEAIVCLANTEGGELWLGVEDDGRPTGLHPEHQMLAGLAGMVAAGHVYPCYMSMQDLDALRERQMASKEKPRYDGTWRPAEGKTLPAFEILQKRAAG